LLFALLDAAGRHDDVRETLIDAQNTFRTLGSRLFEGHDLNEATAMMCLCGEMNRTIMERSVRSCPAFLGCYNEDLGTICYANAGHTSALIRDRVGIGLLEATGLLLGLFSHLGHSAATCALAPGSVLLAVSRGVVEAEYAGEEFGLERAMAAFQRADAQSAHALCMDALQAIRTFTRMAPSHNDVTALVLRRT
jgi:serine phosphatase RsbU (regulator of sigma subunit)